MFRGRLALRFTRHLNMRGWRDGAIDPELSNGEAILPTRTLRCPRKPEAVQASKCGVAKPQQSGDIGPRAKFCYQSADNGAK
jgi:hypothetical protein